MAIKYKWLVEQLREIISDSIQKGSNKLPTEQELAVRYRVSRQTVRAALAVLEDEREIRRIKGSGAYITGTLLSFAIFSMIATTGQASASTNICIFLFLL